MRVKLTDCAALAHALARSWRTGAARPSRLQDCSIQISPITDPSCADPTDDTPYPYGAIQMTAYFKSPDEIRTVIGSDTKK